MAISSTSFKRGNGAAVGHGPRKQPTPKKIAAKLVEDLRVAARELTPKALKTLEAINDDEPAPPAARISAASTILAYGWGKPKETVNATVRTTLEDLVLAAARIEAMEAEQGRLIESYALPPREAEPERRPPNRRLAWKLRSAI
jgi:hypothetical protein